MSASFDVLAVWMNLHLSAYVHVPDDHQLRHHDESGGKFLGRTRSFLVASVAGPGARLRLKMCSRVHAPFVHKPRSQKDTHEPTLAAATGCLASAPAVLGTCGNMHLAKSHVPRIQNWWHASGGHPASSGLLLTNAATICF